MSALLEALRQCGELLPDVREQIAHQIEANRRDARQEEPCRGMFNAADFGRADEYVARYYAAKYGDPL